MPKTGAATALRTADDGGPAAANRNFAKVIVLNSPADLYVVASQSSGGSLG